MNFQPFFSKILPVPKGLRVLMYHKFSVDKTDFLTVNTAQFEDQLAFLVSKGYIFIGLQDVINHIESGKKLPKNAVLLTFDDAYISQKTLAEPILKKYKARGVMFVPTAFVGQSSSWDSDSAPILDIDELKNLDPTIWELALHSHTHFNFKTATLDSIIADIEQNISFFKTHNWILSPALAYPYGARPKDSQTLKNMKAAFTKMPVKAAFRIGNRVNKYPLSNPFEIQRIDVRGTDTFEDFKFKLTFGRLF